MASLYWKCEPSVDDSMKILKKHPELVVSTTEEWKYTMRRSMQEIAPGVYLGSYSSAMKSKLESLLSHSITHIICVRQDVEAHVIKPNFPEHFKYLTLNIADAVTENIIQHIPKVRQFIDEGLAVGGRILVHGNSGISRSAALVLAYVMEKYGLTYQDAFTIVQLRRFCINPNEGFMAQLMEYEPIYKAQQTRRNGQCSMERRSNKRHHDEVEDQTFYTKPVGPRDAMDTC